MTPGPWALHVGCVGRACQGFICMMTAVVFYCCHKNDHKLRGSKQHEFISSQFCVSEVWVSWAGFSAPGLTRPRSKCRTARALLWRCWGRLCSQAYPGRWQSSVLCGCTTELLFPPGGVGTSLSLLRPPAFLVPLPSPSSKPAMIQRVLLMLQSLLLLLPQLFCLHSRKFSAFQGSCD